MMQKDKVLRKENFYNFQEKDIQANQNTTIINDRSDYVISFYLILTLSTIFLISKLLFTFEIKKFNEYCVNNYEKNYKKVIKDVSKIENELQGQLVEIEGKMDCIEQLEDNLLGIKIPNSIKIFRIVQKYVWVEQKSFTNNKLFMGLRNKKQIQYSYNLQWVDYNNEIYFWNNSKADNYPIILNQDESWIIKSKNMFAKQVKIGAYNIPIDLLEQLENYMQYSPTDEDLIKLNQYLSPYMNNQKFYIDTDDYFYVAKSIQEPSYGDYRIKYLFIPSNDYRVIGALDQDQIKIFNQKDQKIQEINDQINSKIDLGISHSIFKYFENFSKSNFQIYKISLLQKNDNIQNQNNCFNFSLNIFLSFAFRIISFCIIHLGFFYISLIFYDYCQKQKAAQNLDNKMIFFLVLPFSICFIIGNYCQIWFSQAKVICSALQIFSLTLLILHIILALNHYGVVKI